MSSGQHHHFAFCTKLSFLKTTKSKKIYLVERRRVHNDIDLYFGVEYVKQGEPVNLKLISQNMLCMKSIRLELQIYTNFFDQNNL